MLQRIANQLGQQLSCEALSLKHPLPLLTSTVKDCSTAPSGECQSNCFPCPLLTNGSSSTTLVATAGTTFKGTNVTLGGTTTTTNPVSASAATTMTANNSADGTSAPVSSTAQSAANTTMTIAPIPLPPSGLDIALIGGVVGGVVGLIAIIALVACVVARRRRKTESKIELELPTNVGDCNSIYAKVDMPRSSGASDYGLFNSAPRQAEYDVGDVKL